MKQYFAIHVRTGYESSIANKLISLNENTKNRLGIGNVIIPMEDIFQIDTTAATAKQVSRVSFTGYVFVELVVYTAEVFQSIRSLSEGVYTILKTPISQDELQTFVSEKVELVVDAVSMEESTLVKAQAFLSRKVTLTANDVTPLNKVHFKRSFFKFNKEVFVSVAKRLRLTIQHIVQNPQLLIKGVLQYETVN